MTDGAALILILNWRKKKLKNYPLEPRGLGPLLSASMGSTTVYPGRKSPFLMTDTSAGLAWTVTCHHATLACEETGRWSFSSDWGRLNSAAFRNEDETAFHSPHIKAKNWGLQHLKCIVFKYRRNRDQFFCIKKNGSCFAPMSRPGVFPTDFHTSYWLMMVFGKHRRTARKWRKRTGRMELGFIPGPAEPAAQWAFVFDWN